jgi:hypothetical protein
VKVAGRILISLLVLGSGIYLLLGFVLGAPSFWWPIAGLLIVLAGLSGFFSLASMAGFALPPLIVLTPLVMILNVWNRESAPLLIALGVAFISAAFSLILSRKNFWTAGRKYLIASSIVLALGFGVDRAFTNKVKVHGFEMNWAVGSGDPMGAGPDAKEGQRKVVIYRKDGTTTCYDAIYSNELADHLQHLQKPIVHVEYEVFYDFGKDRAYNVRSIEGLLITREGHPVLRTADGFGGAIENGTSTGTCIR